MTKQNRTYADGVRDERERVLKEIEIALFCTPPLGGGVFILRRLREMVQNLRRPRRKRATDTSKSTKE
jgi:hypothetical protein